MQKQAPSVGRILTMVLFALSCFGLLLFLWLSFGGPIPLKPKAYRFQVQVPEATTLGVEADVRMAGVNIGKVARKDASPNKTVVTIELERRFAPIDQDARAMLRQKTLLGETYVELTPGRPGGPKVPEGGSLDPDNVQAAVQLDEILNALDKPTQRLFRVWQQDTGAAVRDSGPALNDAIGNLPRFAGSGSDLLQVLDAQEGALSRLVKNTGVVFGAITEREGQLRRVITGVDQTFEATAREKEALAETFRIFPTFLDESRATMVELESFSRETHPLVRDLRPALRDLRPTLRDVRALAPDLRDFYRDLDPLITVSKRGLPALAETLRGLRPLLASVQPFLEELNPQLEWLEYQQHFTADFFVNGAGALADVVEDPATGTGGHYLGQFGLNGSESAAINNRNRPPQSRGNAYLDAVSANTAEKNRRMILPNFDCRNTPEGVHTTTKGDKDDHPSCYVDLFPGFKRNTHFPHIRRADYSKP